MNAPLISIGPGDYAASLADREEANDRNPSESRSSHEPVEFAGSDTTIADGQP